MEESELHEVLRSTIANPDSAAYKNMIQTIFMQSVALPAADFAYDNDFYRVYSNSSCLRLSTNDLYRAMHFSAKHSLALACHQSVCLSVCDGGL